MRTKRSSLRRCPLKRNWPVDVVVAAVVVEPDLKSLASASAWEVAGIRVWPTTEHRYDLLCDKPDSFV